MRNHRKHFQCVKFRTHRRDVRSVVNQRRIGAFSTAMKIDPLAAVQCHREHVIQRPERGTEESLTLSLPPRKKNHIHKLCLGAVGVEFLRAANTILVTTTGRFVSNFSINDISATMLAVLVAPNEVLFR